jgi:hypothetical protein
MTTTVQNGVIRVTVSPPYVAVTVRNGRGPTGASLGDITLGTGVSAALETAINSSGAFVIYGSALGEPSSGTLTSCTGLPVSTGITGFGTGVATAAASAVNGSGGFITYATFAPASGKLLTLSNTLTFAGTDSTTMTFPPESASVGYLNMPQQSKSAAYELVLGDSGKHIYHPSSDNNARTFTIPANSSVAFPVGTVVTFVNEVNTVTIAITTDTMTLAGAGSTGSRTLAANGIATAIKVASTKWVISGTGLT